jgi:putative RecB family exonuclease
MVSGSLSPSRAGDFMTCPLRYRYRVIDRLVEPPSEAATRGTLVHAVLERLFDLPAADRTLEHAVELLDPSWQELLEQEPELASLFAVQDEAAPADTPNDRDSVDSTAAFEAWLESARRLLSSYFALEDPTRLQPAGRELRIEHELFDGLVLRGIVDRLDAAPSGALRVVDYKTGRSPGPAFEKSALFQMKFYALLLWHTRGVVPAELRLYYLGDGATLVYHPDLEELQRFERTVRALWAAIARAHETGDWRPRKSRLCDWCDHQSRCPEFGGVVPPVPVKLGPTVLEEPPVAVCEAEG